MSAIKQSRFTSCKVVLVRLAQDTVCGSDSIVLGASDPAVFNALKMYVWRRQARTKAFVKHRRKRGMPMTTIMELYRLAERETS